MGRARTSGGHLAERLVQRGGDLDGAQRAGLPLGDRPHEVELFVHLVQRSHRAADGVAHHLPGDLQHRRRRRVRGRHAGTGVVDADTGHDERHAGPARGACVAVGHERRRLLVARREEADAIGHVVETVERVHHLVAGQPEDDLDALFDQLLGERLPAGELCHQMISPSIVMRCRMRSAEP